MANVFLIFGNVGSGKSTFASNVATKEDAHIFTIDDWMRSLFMMDAPEPLSYDWVLERVGRVEAQILHETQKLTTRGIPVVLDAGFPSLKQRTRVRDFCKANDIDVVQYFLDVDKATRWQRIQHRNADKGRTFNVQISEQVFESCEKLFEPLSAEELASATVVTS